jgi:hypothetical protein
MSHVDTMRYKKIKLKHLLIILFSIIMLNICQSMLHYYNADVKLFLKYQQLKRSLFGEYAASSTREIANVNIATTEQQSNEAILIQNNNGNIAHKQDDPGYIHLVWHGGMRLGNFMFIYASLMGIAHITKKKPLLTGRFPISQHFNFSIKSNNRINPNKKDFEIIRFTDCCRYYDNISRLEFVVDLFLLYSLTVSDMAKTTHSVDIFKVGDTFTQLSTS